MQKIVRLRYQIFFVLLLVVITLAASWWAHNLATDQPSSLHLTWPVREARIETEDDAGILRSRFYTVSGMPVRAIAAGRVTQISEYDDNGEIVIDNGEGLLVIYTNIAATVSKGQIVQQAMRIGHVIEREPPNLEVVVQVDGKSIDPLPLLRIPNQLPSDETTLLTQYESLDSIPIEAVLRDFVNEHPDSREKLARLIESVRQTYDPEHPVLARLLFAMARVARQQGDYESAIASAIESNRIATAFDDKSLVAAALEEHAAAFYVQGKYDLASPLFERALNALDSLDSSKLTTGQSIRLANAVWNVINVRTELNQEADTYYGRYVKFLETDGVEQFKNAIRLRMIENRFVTGNVRSAATLIEEIVSDEVAGLGLDSPWSEGYGAFRRLQLRRDFSADSEDALRRQALAAEAALRMLAGNKNATPDVHLWYLYVARELDFPRSDYEHHFRLADQAGIDSSDFLTLKLSWLQRKCKSDCVELIEIAARLAVDEMDHGEHGDAAETVEIATAALRTLRSGGRETAYALAELGNLALRLERWDLARQCMTGARSLIARRKLVRDPSRDLRVESGAYYAEAQLSPSDASRILSAGIDKILAARGSEALRLWATGPLLFALQRVDSRAAAAAVERSLPHWIRLKVTYDERDVDDDAMVETATHYINALAHQPNSDSNLPIYEAILNIALATRGFEDGFTVSARVVMVDVLLRQEKRVEANALAMENLAAINAIDSLLHPDKETAERSTFFRASIKNIFSNGTAAGPGVSVPEVMREAVLSQVIKSLGGAVGTSVKLSGTNSEELFSALQSLGMSRSGAVIRKYRVGTAKADPQLAELLKRHGVLLERWAAVVKEIREGPTANSFNLYQRTALLRDRMTLAKEIDECELEIRTIAKDFPSDRRQTTVAEVSEKLRPDEMLLWLAPADERVFAVYLTQSDTWVRELPVSSWKMAESLALLRSTASRHPQHSDSASFDLETSYAVHDLLLGPSGAELRGATALTVIDVDSTREFIPALLADRVGSHFGGGHDYREVNWLTNKVSLRTVLSLSQIADRMKLVNDRKPMVLALGGAIKHLEPVGGTKNYFLALQLARFDVLPHAEAELRSVALALPKSQVDLVLGSAASEKSARELLQSDRYNVLVFATHGIQEGEIKGTVQPALLMAPGTGAVSDDGLLAADEISGLRLGADLVVLSACNTTAGMPQLGNQRFSGLVLSFLKGGVGEVIATDWALFSESAALVTPSLMRRMHQGFSTEAALAGALKDLRSGSGGRFSHPYFWASYVLTGGGESSELRGNKS